jgi:hypothetical protein
LDVSLRLYRETRREAQRLLTEVKAAGFDQIYLDGDGEIADICQLTCMELQIQRQEQPDGCVPVLEVDGQQMGLRWPQGGTHG